MARGARPKRLYMILVGSIYTRHATNELATDKKKEPLTSSEGASGTGAPPTLNFGLFFRCEPALPKIINAAHDGRKTTGDLRNREELKRE